VNATVATAYLLGEPSEVMQPLAQARTPFRRQKRRPAQVEAAECHDQRTGVAQGADDPLQLGRDGGCRERAPEGIVGAGGHDGQVWAEGQRLVELPLADLDGVSAGPAHVEVGGGQGGGEAVRPSSEGAAAAGGAVTPVSRPPTMPSST